MALGRVREALGLEYAEFEVALLLGEVRTVPSSPTQRRVPQAEVDRLLAEGGGPPGADGPSALRERLRLVTAAGAAGVMGVGRGRFVLLARAGLVRPVRWYVNQYRVVVWMYLAREVAEFAEDHPELLRGRLPAVLRQEAGEGPDLRARGWRERRAAQLARDAPGPWEEAAVWASVLGPEAVGESVPDPYERAHLRRVGAALAPGRPGWATAETIRTLTTADDPDEIGYALLALGEALGRARLAGSAPRPAPVEPAREASGDSPPGSPPADPSRRPEPGLPPQRALARPSPRTGSPRRPAAGPRPEPTARDVSGAGPGGASGVTPKAVAAAGPRGVAGPRHASRREAGARGRLRGLLSGWRAVAGPTRQSSPTSVSRTTARASSSEAARSTSAEMPQP